MDKDDILFRLRKWAEICRQDAPPRTDKLVDLLEDAATEIEKLRTSIEDKDSELYWHKLHWS